MATYEPTRESLAAHPVPEWYHDAKLGIFVHWGIYSVPAWAPEPDEGHAYAEWYPRYMHQAGTPTHEYHRERYGDREYLDFVHDWRAERWDPGRWADFFADVGARYVVLTGEHHDGFPLWPSHYAKHNAAEVGPERDLVGDLCAAVRARGLKFAASYHANLNYYQPGFEGPFGHPDYHGSEPFEDTRPGPEYVDFMNAKHRELMRRYEPDLLWFDTPQADADHLRSRELIAEYYERAAEWGKEVAVNDRASTDDDALAGLDPGGDESADGDAASGGDFATPEYATFDDARPFKWEACRGIGHSFGYNRREGPEDHLTGRELVHTFVDVVSKNGNLLINVGPRADGTIPDLQREPLEGLGDWLDVHGEAIYGTRPWVVAEGGAESDGGAVAASPAGAPVRFTWRDGTLYAIALEWPGERLAVHPGAHVDADVERATLLGDGERRVGVSGGTAAVELPADPPVDRPAYAVALDGVPRGS